MSRTQMDEGEKVQDVSAAEVPLYGQREHQVLLDTSHCEDEELFVVVEGSRFTHVTKAAVGADGRTLSFVLPGHDVPEAVSVTLYRFFQDQFHACGLTFSLHYMKDLAQDIADYFFSNSNHLGAHSYLHLQTLFSEWTHREEESTDIKEDLRSLDENITCAISNLVDLKRWTDGGSRKHSEAGSDLHHHKPLLDFAVHLGLVHLSHFITAHLNGQRSLARVSPEVDTALQALDPQHSAGSVIGVLRLWSSSSSLLRFCPSTNSLCLTVQNSQRQSSSHHTILHTLRERLHDSATPTTVSALKADGEKNQKQQSPNDEVNNPLTFNTKHGTMEIQTERGDAEGDAAAEKVHVSGVTSDSTKTDAQSWDMEDTSLMDMEDTSLMDGSTVDDLSPSLVALELNCEDDSTDATTPTSPFLSDVDGKRVRLQDLSPFLVCTRSLSASSCEHTSKEPKQDIRLRSYSYSSSKIGFRTRESSSPEQKTTVSEPSHGRRELSFRRRAQSAEDDCSLELVQSLQHLTLSEFLKEIEEEERDKCNAPVKAESEKHKVIRTFSFLKNRMSTTRNKAKGKKEAKQLNGHRFSSGSCLGLTMCVVCDKPATGKDILHCSVCTAIVHKNCKDSIPPCLKTFQNKYAVPMVRNKTASLPQNFVIREGPPPFVPAPCLSVVIPDENKDTEAPPLTHHSERLETESSASESHQSEVIGSNEDPIITPVSTTDFSSGEDCVDAYIFKDILVDAAHYEAETWSSSVDHKFCRKQDRVCVKRQDVIYELMQTEIHHLQTLHVMAEVFRKGLKDEVGLDADAVERLFPCLDQLLLFHHGFFSSLKERRQNSRCQGQNNYLIERIGDVLLQQFSDENGKKITRLYGEFCSHHMEAVGFFKELQLNNKKFQNFIKQQGNNYLVRRREIPECILLITQRITKYPVLLERILQYTQRGTEEHSDLSRALALIRELIAAVDQRVCKYERRQKLQEVWTRMENRSSAKLKNGHTFRKQDLMRPGQTLLHEGVLLWKSATGRLKDVLALLLTDAIVFLLEKDQKFVFAAVDQKPPVIALQKLIVREVANEERGMFLISASTAGPEMYEVHTSSKDERNTWMRLIREAVESCPEEEQEYTSESEEERRAADARLQKIQRLQENLMSYDQLICSSLEEKLQIYAELSAVSGANNTSAEPRLLVQLQEDAPQAALLLTAALREAEKLKVMFSPKPKSRRVEPESVFCSSPVSHLDSAETEAETDEESCSKDSHIHSVETQKNNIDPKVCQSVLSLTQLLYSLKAAVTLQDSWYEVQRLLSESERPSPRTQPRPHFSSVRVRGNALQEQEKQRNLERRKEEVATAQRLQDQLRVEKERWEKECETRESRQEELERSLRERESEYQREAERLRREREELDAQLVEYQESLERLKEGQRSVEKERERLQNHSKRLQVWRDDQQRHTVLPHMLIALDTHQSTAVIQPADPGDNGSVFVNEANTGINNRHVHHRENDASAHNCLNALLARSSSRRSPGALSTAHPGADCPTWVMGPGYFFSPAGGLGNEQTPTDQSGGSESEAWSSPAESFMLPHPSDSVELFSTQTESGGEEPQEETIVYL